MLRTLYLVLLALVLFVPAAHATSMKQLEEEIEELKRINNAQATNLAQAMNQMQEVLAEFQKVHGQVDASLHTGNRLDKYMQDNQRRLSTLEDKSLMLATQLEELKRVGLLPAAQVRRVKEFQQFEAALSKVNAENYKGAIAALKTFIANNKASPYASYARYWIGESYYAMRDFPAAVAAFQEVIKKDPNSHKVPSSLLRQGFSFFEMQSLEESKAFLKKLTTRFPQSFEATLAQEKLKKINEIEELKKKEALERQEVM